VAVKPLVAVPLHDDEDAHPAAADPVLPLDGRGEILVGRLRADGEQRILVEVVLVHAAPDSFDALHDHIDVQPGVEGVEEIVRIAAGLGVLRHPDVGGGVVQQGSQRPGGDRSVGHRQPVDPRRVHPEARWIRRFLLEVRDLAPAEG
jgi:hypothetical protein